MQYFTSASANSSAPTITVYSPNPTNSPPLRPGPPQLNGPNDKGRPDTKAAILITAGIAGTSTIFLSIGLLIFFCCWKRHRRLQKAKSEKQTKPVRKQLISQPVTPHVLPPSQPPRPPRPPSPMIQSAKNVDFELPRQEPQQNLPRESNLTPKPPSQRLPPFLVNYAQQRRPAPLPPISTATPDTRKQSAPVSYNASSQQLKGYLADLPINPRRPQTEPKANEKSRMVDDKVGITTPTYKQPSFYDTKQWQANEYLPEKVQHGQRVPINEEPSRRSPDSDHSWRSLSPSSSLDEYYGTVLTSMSSPALWQPLQPRKQNPNAYPPQPPMGNTPSTTYSVPTGSQIQKWEAEDNLPPLPAFPRPPKPGARQSELSATSTNRNAPEFPSRYEYQHTEGPSRHQSSIGYADSGIWTDVSVTSFQNPTEVSSNGLVEYAGTSLQALPI